MALESSARDKDRTTCLALSFSFLCPACFGTNSTLERYSTPGCRKVAVSCEESHCVAHVGVTAHSHCKNHTRPLLHTCYRTPCPFRLGYGTGVKALVLVKEDYLDKQIFKNIDLFT